MPGTFRCRRRATGPGVECILPQCKKGGILFGTSPIVLAKLVEKVRSACSLPLIVKLTPNVTDITETARAAKTAVLIYFHW